MGFGSPHNPFSTHPMPSDPLPQEHWIVGLAWAWDIPVRNRFKRNHKKEPMPEVGLEPTRPCGQRILSPPRLPFRHSGT